MKKIKYILDTDICTYLIKKHPAKVLSRIQQCKLGDIGISAITAAELNYGANKSQHYEKNILALDNFLLSLEVISFDYSAALVYGKVRALLERSGKTIGSLDMLIGAHCKSMGATLVTNNEKEFSRIPELVIDNWVK